MPVKPYEGIRAPVLVRISAVSRAASFPLLARWPRTNQYALVSSSKPTLLALSFCREGNQPTRCPIARYGLSYYARCTCRQAGTLLYSCPGVRTGPDSSRDLGKRGCCASGRIVCRTRCPSMDLCEPGTCCTYVGATCGPVLVQAEGAITSCREGDGRANRDGTAQVHLMQDVQASTTPPQRGHLNALDCSMLQRSAVTTTAPPPTVFPLPVPCLHLVGSVWPVSSHARPPSRTQWPNSSSQFAHLTTPHRLAPAPAPPAASACCFCSSKSLHRRRISPQGKKSPAPCHLSTIHHLEPTRSQFLGPVPIGSHPIYKLHSVASCLWLCTLPKSFPLSALPRLVAPLSPQPWPHATVSHFIFCASSPAPDAPVIFSHYPDAPASDSLVLPRPRQRLCITKETFAARSASQWVRATSRPACPPRRLLVPLPVPQSQPSQALRYRRRRSPSPITSPSHTCRRMLDSFFPHTHTHTRTYTISLLSPLPCLHIHPIRVFHHSTSTFYVGLAPEATTDGAAPPPTPTMPSAPQPSMDATSCTAPTLPQRRFAPVLVAGSADPLLGQRGARASAVYIRAGPP